MAKGRMKSIATADTKQAQKAYEDLKNKMRGISTEAHRGGQSITTLSRIIQNESGKIERSLGKVGKVAASVFSFQQAASFTSKIINVRGEMQKLEIAFNTMLKSEEKTNALMGQMVKTAATTPFELMDVASGAKSLLAYGVAAEEVNETIIRLGNIAAALNIPLGDMAYLFGTTMTQGKVLSKDMYQFMGRGIPIAEELAKQFGVAKDEILGMCSEGKVGFEDIKKALWSMTDEGGKFYNLMQEQSKTLAGQISNLQDSFDMMLNDLGSRIEDTASKGIEAANHLIENYEKYGRIIAELVSIYGTYRAALLIVNATRNIAINLVKGYTVAELAQYRALLLVEKAQALLNKTILKNPYVLAAAAVAGLAYSIFKYHQVIDQTKRAEEAHGGTLDKLKQKYDGEKSRLDGVIGALQDETLTRTQQIAAIHGLENEYQAIFNKYIDEKGHITDLIALQRELNGLREGKKAQDNQDMLTHYEDMARRAQYYLSQIENNGSLDLASHNGTMRIWKEFNELATNDGAPKRTIQNPANMKEVLDFYTRLVNSQKNVVNQDILNAFIASLQEKSKQELETMADVFSNKGVLSTMEQKQYSAIYDVLAKKFPTDEATTNLKAVIAKIETAKEEIKAMERKVASTGLTDAEIKELESKRKELDDLEKKYKNLSGKEYGKASSGDKAEAEYLKKRQDFATKMQRAYEKAQNDLANATISAQKDGYSKEKAALEQENKEREQDIKNRYQDQLKQIEQLEREKYMKEHGGSDKGFVFDASKNELAIQLLKVTTEEYAAEAARFGAEMDSLDEKYYKNRLKLKEDYLKQYGTYAQKEKAIQDSYARQIKDARERGEEDEAKLLEAERDSALYDLKKNYSGLYALIFADAQTLTKNQLAKAIQDTQEEIEKATSSGDIERLSELYERLREQMLVQTSNSASSWGFGGIVKGFKDMKTAMTDYETALKNNDREGVNTALMNQENANVLLKESLTEVFDVFGELGAAMESFGGTIGEIGEVFSGLASSADDIVTAFTSKDKGALISTAISGVLDIVSMVGNQIAANKEAQEEWNQTVQQCAHEYTMLQLEALEYKEANMFGVENPYKKAIDSAKLYSESMGELYKMQSKLENGQVQTGTKQVVSGKNVATGVGAGAAAGAALGSIIPGLGTLIGAGIGALLGGIIGACATETVPVFESLTATYGSILKEGTETFELNPQILADYDKLDNATKQIVDNWDEIREKALQAEQEMRDNFSSLAGNIGAELSDSLANAFRNGNVRSAIDDFKSYTTGVMEDIVEQLIFAAVFQDMFDTLEDKMFDSFGEGGDQSIVDDLMWMEQEYAKRLGEYEKAMTDAKDSLSKQGYDAWAADEEEQRKGATKSGITASQDSVDYQNARLTTMQGHTFEINEGVKSMKAQHMALISNTASILREVQGIHDDTTSIASKTIRIDENVEALRHEVGMICKNGIILKR